MLEHGNDAGASRRPPTHDAPALTVACVRTGTKYDLDYVARLRDGVARHLDRPHRFICLTDQVAAPIDVEPVWIGHLDLQGWWGKMALFSPAVRGAGRCLYLDLDSVIVGDLAPLADWDGDFAICENFTRLAGHATWPCRYGSCAMVFRDGWGQDVWDAFRGDRLRIMVESPKGDQQAIEHLVPDAALLQRELAARGHRGFFLNKRDLARHPECAPAGAALVVFGGAQRPHNCRVEWVAKHWINGPV